METKGKPKSDIESTEVTEASVSIKTSRPIEAVDDSVENVCLGSSPKMKDIATCLKRCDNKPATKVIKEASNNTTSSVDTEISESNKDIENEERSSDYIGSNEAEDKSGDIVPDRPKRIGDVCNSFEGSSKHINKDSAVADKCLSSTYNKMEDRRNEVPRGDSCPHVDESCDAPDNETNLLVEEGLTSLPMSNNNVSGKTDNNKDVHTFVETNLNSLVPESTNSDTRLKRHADESVKKLINSEKIATDSLDTSQKTNYAWLSSVEQSATIPLLNEEKPNSDSDMDIDSSDTDSDPEFLPCKPPDKSDQDDSALSSVKYSKQAENEAQKSLSECDEVQINEGGISSTLLTPDDVIVECRDNKNFFYCNVCLCTIHKSMKNVKVHKRGKSHKAAMIKYKKSVVMSAKSATSSDKTGPNLMLLDCYIERYKPRGYYCRVCNFIAEKFKIMDDHVRGKWHETNICIVKGREIVAQQQKDHSEKGTQDEMKELEEEYSKVLEMERLKSWNAYSAAIAEDPSKNKMPISIGSCYNIQDPSLYGGYQSDFQQNQYYQNFMHTMNQDMFCQPSALVDPSINPEMLMLSQIAANQQAASFFPYTQQTSVPYMSKVQQTPVPDTTKFQQNQVPTTSLSQENTSFFGLPCLINKERDAEIIIEVINSLLQTYLKYKLGGLPKLLFKLPHRSSKFEENVTDINKFATGRTAKQNLHNSQNPKYKYQSSFTPEDKRPLFDLYACSSNKFVENKSSKRSYANETSYNEKICDLPMNNKKYRSYQSCIEARTRKKIALESTEVMRRKNEDNFSRNMKENESSFDELLHYRSSYKDDITPKRTGHNEPLINDSYRKYKNYNEEDDVSLQFTRPKEPSIYDSLKQYRSSINEDITRQNEPCVSDLFKQYRGFKKEDSSAQSTRQRESYNTDFSDIYSRSSSIEDKPRSSHQNAQSIFDLMKKYRNSSSFPHH